MKPEDWQEAMENEAANVPDAQWAQETRRALWWRGVALNAGFFAALEAFRLMLGNLVQADISSAADWVAVMGSVSGVSLGMGWKRHDSIAVGVATLVYLPTEWLMQALTHQGPDLTAGEALFRMVILAVLAVNAAGVGAALRRFLRPS